MFTRRKMLALSGASLALSACGQTGSGGGGGLLRVGSQRGGTKALMIAAGVLEGAAYSVEWSEFPAAQPLLEALGSGAVDLGLAGDAPFLFAYQGGSPVKAVQAQAVPRRPDKALCILVPGSSPAQKLSDLKGRRVATTKGSIGHYLVLRALASQHLPRDFLHISFLSPSDAKAALQSGAVDAWSVWVPYVSMALAEGNRVLVDGQTLVNGVGFDVASEKAITSKRAMVKDFLAREAKALEWARGHVDAYSAVLAKETGLPPAIAHEMVIRNARLAEPITASLIAEEQVVIDTFRDAGEIRGDRPLKDAFAIL